MTWLSRIPSSGVSFLRRQRSDETASASKPLTLANHAINGTQLFKQLIVRQRRPQRAFRGRYEQTVDDVYSRLPQLTTKGVWQAEKRKKEKNKRKAIEHFSLLADIVVCLLGVPEEWKNVAFRSELLSAQVQLTCSKGISQTKDSWSRISFIRAWIRWLKRFFVM